MICPNCGIQIPEGSLFCPDCGSMITPIYSESERKNERGVSIEEPSRKDIKKATDKTVRNKTGRIVLLSIVFGLAIVFVFRKQILEASYNYERKYALMANEEENEEVVDLYEVAKLSEDEVSKKYKLDKDLSDGDTHVYDINEHGATVTYNEYKMGSVDTMLITYEGEFINNDTEYTKQHCSIAGYRPGDDAERINSDNRFKKMFEHSNGLTLGKMVVYEEVGNQDTNLIVSTYKDSNVIGTIMYLSYDGLHDETLQMMSIYQEELVDDQYYDASADGDRVNDGRATNDYTATNAEENRVDYDDLKETIMIYYAMYYGTNSVDAEIDHEDEDSVTIRLFDPYSMTSSSTLGFYEYNKITGIWIDNATGEALDFESAAEAHNEWVEGHGSYPEETTVEEYYVYVKAPDGYVNLRTGPGTEYDIICSIPNGEALELYPEEATAENGKKWAKVSYWADGSWNTGYVIASQIEY